MSCQHPDGHPCCEDRACRKRWLTGSTTGEDFKPASVTVLIADLLETWCGTWFTDQQIVTEVQKLRPNTRPAGIMRLTYNLRRDGGTVVGGVFVPVESRRVPSVFASTSGLWEWAMMVKRRAGLD